MRVDNIGKYIQDWFVFVRKYSQITCMFYLAQNSLIAEGDVSIESRTKLVALDNKRRDIQSRIASISKTIGIICQSCGGICCFGSYNHFSAIDFWLRKYSSHPISNYGNEMHIPLYIQVLRDRFNLNIKKPTYIIPRNGCSHLNKEGCNISPEDRPIKCIAFTCRKFRENLSCIDRDAYADSILELYKITYDCINILSVECGLPNNDRVIATRV